MVIFFKLYFLYLVMDTPRANTLPYRLSGAMKSNMTLEVVLYNLILQNTMGLKVNECKTNGLPTHIYMDTFFNI